MIDLTKTIKIADLLVKIANGEEVPERIRYQGDNFIYRKESGKDYLWYRISSDGKMEIDFSCGFLENNVYSFEQLNDEVEIIEDIPKEDKKIEKIQLSNGGLTIHTRENNDYTLSVVHKEIIKKINEIIDYINKE